MSSDLGAAFLTVFACLLEKWGISLHQSDDVGMGSNRNRAVFSAVSINRRAAPVAGIFLVPGLVAGFISVCHYIQAMFLKPMTS